jgi:hypothetical protein
VAVIGSLAGPGWLWELGVVLQFGLVELVELAIELSVGFRSPCTARYDLGEAGRLGMAP